MKYPKEYLDEIKQRLKVSQVVGQTVKLKKRHRTINDILSIRSFIYFGGLTLIIILKFYIIVKKTLTSKIMKKNSKFQN